MRKIPPTADLFNSKYTIAARLIESSHYGHRAILNLGEFLKGLLPFLPKEYEQISEGVFIAKGVRMSDSAVINGPAVICEEAEIRPGAFIRGNVIVGRGAVVGNSTEVKNSIIFDEAKLPHYNYLGDSIIGYKAHMGAGVIASNQRLDKRSVLIRASEETIDTGMKKLGALIGDFAEIGSGSVLSPGTIIGKNSMIYPLSHVNGVINENGIFDGSGKERYRK